RVFKKTSPNGKITTYLGKRDFIDHGNFVDLIDGMVLIDENYIKENRKITAHLLEAFRYGREDLDVLGLTFRKDLISQTFQVYPVDTLHLRPLTRLQERLKKKLGTNAYPFWFQIRTHSASSVTLQPAQGDTGKPCGVDFELKTTVESLEGSSIDEPKKHYTKINLCTIQKLSPANYRTYQRVHDEPGSLHLEASLNKEMYYHGESIAVNIHIQNNSNKTVKKIKACIAQIADICLFTTASYTCEVAKVESTTTLSKVYNLCPLLSNNKDKRGLALDGQLKHEDTNLASSTTLSSETTKENLGIVVQYKVKVRLNISGPLGGELPFTLTHPKPVESIEERHEQQRTKNNEELNANLIQLDIFDLPRVEDEDIIFEDFARLRVQAAIQNDYPFDST
uniref:Arrestin_C domain-containing protein n=1 Tax=Wuchereria bancrofti TaxID=6293 RepID=A0A1I8ET45_WUCBA